MGLSRADSVSLDVTHHRLISFGVYRRDSDTNSLSCSSGSPDG